MRKQTPPEDPVAIRTFEKRIELTTQGQYRVEGTRLRLFRYRMIVDGAPGPWRKVTIYSNLPSAFWPRVMTTPTIDPDE
jgi:hypothetical protein